MKKVLLVSYYFPPTGGGGVTRALNLTKRFPEFGWLPLVLTRRGVPWGFPRDESLINGIHAQIFRAPCWLPAPAILHQQVNTPVAFLLRFIYSFFVPDKDAGWVIPATMVGLKVIREERVQLILSSSPPPSALLVGYLLHKMTGLPWVADFRDPWTTEPNSLARSPISKLRVATAEKYLERLFLKNANAITAVGEAIAEDLALAVPPSASRIHLVTNGFDPAEFETVQPHRLDGFNLVYTGRLNWGGRSPKPLLQAIKKLIDNDPIWRQRITVWFIGCSESAQLQGLIKDFGLSDVVRIREFVPNREAIAFQKGASVLLMFGNAKTEEGRRHILSGKLFSYLGAGRPILGIIPKESDAAKIIAKTKSGFVVRPDDIVSIKEAIEVAYKRFSSTTDWSADSEGVKDFHWKSIVSNLAGLMDSLVS